MNNCLTCEKRSIKPTAWKTAQTRLHRSGKRQWNTGQYILNLHYRRKSSRHQIIQLKSERSACNSQSRVYPFCTLFLQSPVSPHIHACFSQTHTHTRRKHHLITEAQDSKSMFFILVIYCTHFSKTPNYSFGMKNKWPETI